MAKSNTFETGLTPGTTITTANSAAPDAFDSAVVGVAGALTYETEPSGAGGLAGKVLSGATAESVRVGFASLGTQITTYGRCYIWIPTGSNTFRILGVHTSGAWPATQVASVNLNATRALRWNINGTLSGTTSASLLELTLYRLEYSVSVDAVNGSAEVRVYNADDIGLVTSAAATAVNTGSTGLDQAAFGNIAAFASKEIWLDNIVAGATDWPGPAGGAIVSSEPIAIPQTHPEFGPF